MQSKWARAGIGVLATMFVAGSGFADGGVKLVDRDGDGNIRWNDVAGIPASLTQQEFAALDADGDGIVTTGEFAKAARNAGLKRIIDWADKDGDGTVTEEEWNAVATDLPKNTFQGLDSNHDGVIKQGDAAPGPAQGARPAGGKKTGKAAGAIVRKPGQGEAPEMNEAPKPPKQKPAGQGKGAQTREDRQAARDKMITDADADKDGKVTLEDVRKVKPGLPDRAFKNMDTNNDGVLSAEDAAKPGKQGARKGKPNPEARQQYRERLKAADTDGDGKLNREESKKAFPHMTDEAFGKRDTDGDGFIGPDDRKGKGRQ